MRFQRFVPFAYVLGICFCFFWGCQGNKPLSPSRPISLSVFIPPTQELKSSLLGSSSNELLYRVDGPGMAPVTGTVGPLSITSSYGSIDFSVGFPGGIGRVLSLQLNDASTHQPLAIGAYGVVVGSSAVTDVVVEMGSVTRNCYFTNPGGTFANYAGLYSYSFNTDTAPFGGAVPGPGLDISFPIDPNDNIYMADGQASVTNIVGVGPVTTALNVNSIAYLGKGNLVDHDLVPPDFQFFSDSRLAKGSAVTTTLEQDDIYCVKTGSIPGGHAWVQIVSPGTYGGNAPSFRFRTNGTFPYYAYDPTSADAGVSCISSW
jgi:hypothetical protein